MELALQLAVICGAHDLDALVVLARDGATIASVGDRMRARTLALIAADLIEGEPLGFSATSPDLHVALVEVRGEPCAIAMRGGARGIDPDSIMSDLRRALPAPLRAHAPETDDEDDDEDDGDFDFDLGWGDEPNEALRTVVG